MVRAGIISRGFNAAVGIVAWAFSWLSMCSLLAFIVLAALVGHVGKSLPDYSELAEYEPPTISRIYSGEGRIIDEFARERRLFSPIDEIPLRVREAMISAEDKHFYLHGGYDPVGIVKAVAEAAQGGRLRGASTITQQVMKNFLLGGARSFERKLKEIILAVRLENTLTKDQILELYLNEIFLGQNSYGVTSAAQTYFNKPLDELSIQEAAYLAALPKAPSNYHPVRRREAALARRNFVIREMEENGYIGDDEAREAMAAPLITVQDGSLASFRSELPPRGYFTDEIRRQLEREFGEEEFFEGGLAIRATVDPEFQRISEAALRSGLEKYDRQRGRWIGTGLAFELSILEEEENWQAELRRASLPRDIPGWRPAVILGFGPNGGATVGVEGHPHSVADIIPSDEIKWARPVNEGGRSGPRAEKASDILAIGDVVLVAPVTDADGGFKWWSLRQVPRVQGAFIAMDVNTGRVLAMQGGFSYQHSVFNRATQAERQPGSAFKPFVYAAALDSGYTPATIVVDAPIELDTAAGLWRPTNSSNRFFGPITLRTGIEKSRNLMTIRLANDVGMPVIAGYAENFGLYDSMDRFLANSLGAQETTLLKIAAAYAMFANGGERVYPTLVDRVQDRYGQTIYRHDERFCVDCQQPLLVEGTAPSVIDARARVIDAVTAYQITTMLEGVVRHGTAAATVTADFPVAGKTGTTNESRDAWFVGFTPDIVAGCYVGYDSPESLGRRVYGGTLCGPVFNQFIEAVAERFGTPSFEVPKGGTHVAISRTTGEMITGDPALHEGSVAREFFRFGTEPQLGDLRVIDGGFAMAADLAPYDPDAEEDLADPGRDSAGSFGSLSSGGLY